MGMWSEREAVVVVCSLVHWRFHSETVVEGIIKNSINQKEYPERDKYTFMNMTFTAYPYSEQYGVGHFIGTSQTGVSVRMDIVDRQVL